MTAPDLDRTPAIRERLAAATHGPWEVPHTCDPHSDEVRAPTDAGLSVPVCVVRSPAPNAEFIAHAPEDITWLLGEVERLRVLATTSEQDRRLAWRAMDTARSEKGEAIQERDSLRAAMDAVRALDRRSNLYGPDEFGSFKRDLRLALTTHLPDDTKEA